VALQLEVIAGPEGLDPRDQAGLQGKVYTQALTGKIDGLRFGIVPEGFGWEGLSEADVDESVEQAPPMRLRNWALGSKPFPFHGTVKDGIFFLPYSKRVQPG